MSDTSMIPVVAIASFISFFLTSKIYMLKTSAIAHATLWQYHNCARSHGVSWDLDIPRERYSHKHRTRTTQETPKHPRSRAHKRYIILRRNYD
ncbi:MAG: hypothetical protein GDA56_03500 [Hormoscilla sp. GM7CHS1pb]|nr:hypothetical protein [Hormoscilla sp. GM7CHS1pb]